MSFVKLASGQIKELADWQRNETICIDGVPRYSAEEARNLLPELFAYDYHRRDWLRSGTNFAARWPTLEFYRSRGKCPPVREPDSCGVDLWHVAEQNSPAYSNITAREIEEDPLTPSVLALARAWLVDCDLKHQACKVNLDLAVPTRLLDVGSSDPSHPVRLYEVDFSKKADIRYAALSHCWGIDAGNITKLRLATLTDMKQGIDVASLPQNFHDAIRIARDIGLKHVWIDSLCIIQDHLEDWQIEAAKMGDYYRRAEVTSAALASPSADHGLLCPRHSFETIPRIETDQGPMFLRPPLPSAISVVDGFVDSPIRQPIPPQPLNKRAWAFQERLLSRRILYLTADQLIWQCLYHIVAEDGQFSTKQQGFDSRDEKHVIDLIGRTPQDGDHEYSSVPQTVDSTGWYGLVEKFMSRSISFDQDRLPAIAAIAREVHIRTNTPYCAGLWMGNFCTQAAGLLWQTDRGTSRRASNSSPSWSWSSVIGEVRFYLRENAVVEHRSGLDASLQHWSSKLASPVDPFGEVHGGRLVFEAWTSVYRGSKHCRETTVGDAESHLKLRSQSFFQPRPQSVELEEDAYLILDVQSCHGLPDPLSIDKQVLFLMAVCITRTPSQYCLVLERQDSDLEVPQFRRVGIALSPVPQLCEEYGWTRQMLAIV